MMMNWIGSWLAVGGCVLAASALFGGAGAKVGVPQPQAGPPAVKPAAPIALDVIGGVASTHIIVRTREDVTPVRLTDGRWSFARMNVADRRSVPEVAEAQLAPAEVALANVLKRERATAIRPSLDVVPKNQTLARQLGLDRYYTLEVPHGTNTPVLADVIRDAALNGAFFDVVELDGMGGVAATPPNDPEFAFQYGLHSTSQSICGISGVPGADINALAAWGITTGSDDIIIAVLDSGLHSHVDLSGRILPGFNVVTQSPNVVDGCNSHGTHVTGIIVANPDNALGIAGVTWQSKVVPVVVLNGCGGLESNASDGLTWASNQGVHIINMSLQYYTGSSLFHNAVKYARNSGVVVIAASGNWASPGVVAFPARWPEVIAVAGTNNRDEKWPGSNSGAEVSVAAAGECVRSIDGTSGYSNKNGTSFASPHVAGTAALMLALNPSLTHDEIQTILEQTAQDLGPPGWDPAFGHGRIDAYAALLAVQDTLPTPGDLTGDGNVGVPDLLILLGAWGPCSACGPVDCPADFNGDCTVGVADLLFLLANWG